VPSALPAQPLMATAGERMIATACLPGRRTSPAAAL
jgi:hypothetical protein